MLRVEFLDRFRWNFWSDGSFVQYVFVSFLSRDNTYKILMSICPHLEVGQMSHMQLNVRLGAR